MDRTANPCENLYQYACGGWIKNNPIPADQSRISTYGKLYVDNQRYLWGILEELAREKKGAQRYPENDWRLFCSLHEPGTHRPKGRDANASGTPVH